MRLLRKDYAKNQAVAIDKSDCACSDCALFKDSSRRFSTHIEGRFSCANSDISSSTKRVFIILSSPSENADCEKTVCVPYEFKDLLDSVGIKNYYVTYLVKCLVRPEKLQDNYGNTIPTEPNLKAEFIHKCTELYLIDEINKVKPDVIIAVGKKPTNFFFKSIQISSFRKKFIQFLDNKYPVISLYDVSITQDISTKNKVIEDLEWMKKNFLTENKIEVKSNEKSNYKWITKDNIEEANVYLREVFNNRDKMVLSVDIETTGLNMFDPEKEIYSIAFTHTKNTGICFFWEDVLKYQNLMDLIKWVLQYPEIKKIGQAFKFDMKFLVKKAGIFVKGFYKDTMLEHYLLDESHGSHSLDSLSRQFNVMPGYKDQIKGYIENIKSAPKELVVEYNCQDTDATLRLYDIFKDKIKKLGLSRLSDFNISVSKLLTNMELNGAKIDVKFLEKEIENFKYIQINLEKNIKYKIKIKTGITNINLNSNKQMRDLFFDKLKLKPFGVSKKTRKPSVDINFLEHYAGKYKTIAEIIKLKTYNKILSTYLGSFLENKDDRDFIHCNFNIGFTVTGRLSSSNPNLQNIPKENKIKVDNSEEVNPYTSVKKCFIPRFKDGLLLEADMGQLELRIAAIVSNDKKMKQMFEQGGDIHLRTTQLIFKDKTITKDDPRRKIGKTLNFAVLYLAGPKKVASMIGCSEEEAQGFINSYFREFYGFAMWKKQEEMNLLGKGYCRNLLGRFRRLPNVQSFNKNLRDAAIREGINFHIQSLASDITLYAGVEINKRIIKNKLKSKLIITVHDSFLIDLYPGEQEVIIKIVKEEMEKKRFDFMSVPMVVDIKIGKNWAEMEDLK